MKETNTNLREQSTSSVLTSDILRGTKIPKKSKKAQENASYLSANAAVSQNNNKTMPNKTIQTPIMLPNKSASNKKHARESNEEAEELREKKRRKIEKQANSQSDSENETFSTTKAGNPRYWFLQTNPKEFNPKKISINYNYFNRNLIGWIVKDEMDVKKGDIVFIWRGKGDKEIDYRGIVALGKVVKKTTAASIYKKYPYLDPKHGEENGWAKKQREERSNALSNFTDKDIKELKNLVGDDFVKINALELESKSYKKVAFARNEILEIQLSLDKTGEERAKALSKKLKIKKKPCCGIEIMLSHTFKVENNVHKAQINIPSKAILTKEFLGQEDQEEIIKNLDYIKDLSTQSKPWVEIQKEAYKKLRKIWDGKIKNNKNAVANPAFYEEKSEDNYTTEDQNMQGAEDEFIPNSLFMEGDNDGNYLENAITYIEPISELTFTRHQVASDGDCGYTAFGITREEAYSKLANKENVEKIKYQLRDVISEVLMTNLDFIKYLDIKDLSEVFNDLSDSSSIIQQTAIKRLKKYALNKKIIQAYLNYDIIMKKIDAGWAHPCLLLLLAETQNIALHIWQLDEQKNLIPHLFYPEFIPPNTAQNERKDLLFINNNHFELIELNDSPKRTIINKPAKVNKQTKPRSKKVLTAEEFKEKEQRNTWKGRWGENYIYQGLEEHYTSIYKKSAKPTFWTDKNNYIPKGFKITDSDDETDVEVIWHNKAYANDPKHKGAQEDHDIGIIKKKKKKERFIEVKATARQQKKDEPAINIAHVTPNEFALMQNCNKCGLLSVPSIPKKEELIDLFKRCTSAYLIIDNHSFYYVSKLNQQPIKLIVNNKIKIEAVMQALRFTSVNQENGLTYLSIKELQSIKQITGHDKPLQAHYFYSAFNIPNPPGSQQPRTENNNKTFYQKYKNLHSTLFSSEANKEAAVNKVDITLIEKSGKDSKKFETQNTAFFKSSEQSASILGDTYRVATTNSSQKKIKK